MTVDPLRVVVVEDETLLRHGLHALFQGVGIEVVATAADVPAALAAVRTHRPDLLITDIRIPPGHSSDGLDTALQLRAELPGLAVMLLSQYVSRHYVERLLAHDARAIGYQLKQRVSDVRTFLEDLHRVAAGGIALDADVVTAMLDHADTHAPPARLTDRQTEVLALIAQGRSNSAIAARLHITEKAVAFHTSRIYAELSIHDHDDDHRRVLAVLHYLQARAPGTPSGQD